MIFPGIAFYSGNNSLDHSCNKCCNLIGQQQVFKSHRVLVKSHRVLVNLHRVLVNLHRVPVNFLIDTCRFYHSIKTNQITVFIALLYNYDLN